MEAEWTFADDERRDILVGIHLLATLLDEEQRAIRAQFREADQKAWLCKLAEAQDIDRRERERP